MREWIPILVLYVLGLVIFRVLGRSRSRGRCAAQVGSRQLDAADEPGLEQLGHAAGSDPGSHAEEGHAG